MLGMPKASHQIVGFCMMCLEDLGNFEAKNLHSPSLLAQSSSQERQFENVRVTGNR